ncbi:MAG TPA: cytochrome c oxidase accessory protein CcoG, partial [Flavobacterium sp.]|nr:cytochrome c oxidase accessory protein CcoG [Flavobacterium sp.]
MNKLPEESFRDTIGTINKEGKRAFIFPKKPKGPFYDKRKLLSYFLLVFLVSA